MDRNEFAPGFRLSGFDCSVLAGGVALAALATSYAWWAGMVVALVVGHFFLFCNVFRISRAPELVWAACFTALTGSTITTGIPPWPVTVLSSLCLSAALIAREMRSPGYHGVFWQRVNPDLRLWWESQVRQG